MSAAFAAAASASRSAPGSVAWRRLMIETKPNFLISGTTSALIAPAQATVVSRRWKLVMPSTVGALTSCAQTGDTDAQAAEIKPAAIRKCEFMADLLRWNSIILLLQRAHWSRGYDLPKSWRAMTRR